jgi:hypothetical protein
VDPGRRIITPAKEYKRAAKPYLPWAAQIREGTSKAIKGIDRFLCLEDSIGYPGKGLGQIGKTQPEEQMIFCFKD